MADLNKLAALLAYRLPVCLAVGLVARLIDLHIVQPQSQGAPKAISTIHRLTLGSVGARSSKKEAALKVAWLACLQVPGSVNERERERGIYSEH